MSTPVQIIKRNNKPEWAVLPYELYLKLSEESEMLQDIRDYDVIKASIERGEEEMIPSVVTFAIMDGESPIKVWREYRGLTQQQLAKNCQISAAYISQLESGKRKGTTEVLVAISKALNISLEDVLHQISG